ncbi:Histidine protein methyltransferase 1 homolog [Linum grandiflorum]
MAFVNSEFKLFSAGKGFDESPSFQPAAPRPLPPFPDDLLKTKVSSTVKCPMEQLEIDDGLTLLKGRVRTQEIMGLPNSDLVPGVYEGGLKLWEGSLDLVKALRSEIRKGELSFSRKKVLEVGTCFDKSISISIKSSTEVNNKTKVRYFAGDWSQIHQCLPHVHSGTENSSGESPVYDYDVILMAETIYAVSAQPSLYELVKKCVKRPGGVVYMSAKKYYFGVGGGTRQFLSMVEKDGVMAASLVAEVADGSSNVREVWKLSMKSCPDS